MTSKEIREKYLKFFEERGHKVIPAAPLVPKDDPTTLFTTAGMQPLVPYLLGEPHPEGKRLVNIQPCLRTDDIDEVGDNTHNTFLEMLGNWSLGDYWKKESIEWSLEFLTKELELKKEKLAVTVFEGDDDAPKDEESTKTWENLGIPKNRIFPLGKKDNWWGPVGQTGPCGPDTEIFYWIGEGEPRGAPNTNTRWVEVWNNVFMEYNKTIEDKYEPLAQKNVDTGMGLERISAVVQGKTNIYETDLFARLYEAIEEKTKVSEIRYNRVLADGVRAGTFLIANGVEPANTERGYVLRRLIRRSVSAAYQSGIQKGFFQDLARIVIDDYSVFYPELKENRETIYKTLDTEEERFQKPINWIEVYRNDLKAATDKAFIKTIGQTPILTKDGKASGEYVFENFQTYGVPADLAEDVVKDLSLEYDKEGFQKAMLAHQEKSRTGASAKFSGGLADSSERTIKGHTATHLLHQALRDVLGNNVHQTGSNITAERVRFDFSFDRKLTQEEIDKIEKIVNEKIEENLSVKSEILLVEKAKALGAIGLFAEKYPEYVKVYSIGNNSSTPSGRSEPPYSREFCGGPHVANTKEIGRVTITKEESAGSGVRRIYARIEN